MQCEKCQSLAECICRMTFCRMKFCLTKIRFDWISIALNKWGNCLLSIWFWDYHCVTGGFTDIYAFATVNVASDYWRSITFCFSSLRFSSFQLIRLCEWITVCNFNLFALDRFYFTRTIFATWGFWIEDIRGLTTLPNNFLCSENLSFRLSIMYFLKKESIESSLVLKIECSFDEGIYCDGDTNESNPKNCKQRTRTTVNVKIAIVEPPTQISRHFNAFA